MGVNGGIVFGAEEKTIGRDRVREGRKKRKREKDEEKKEI